MKKSSSPFFFLHDLFSNNVSSSDYFEEEVMVYLQVVSLCLPGGPEESHNLNQHSQCHDQDSN
jgi:hypothetical protein